MRVIELQLSCEELPLRDELFKRILSSEIKLKSVELKQFAMQLIAIGWESRSLTTKKDILEKAVRFSNAPS